MFSNYSRMQPQNFSSWSAAHASGGVMVVLCVNGESETSNCISGRKKLNFAYLT